MGKEIMSAPVTAEGLLALYELGHPVAAVYDGSWTEWSAARNCPKPKESEP